MAILSDNARGAILMMASMIAFTLNDTCFKALSDELPLFQALLIRGVVTMVLLFGIAWGMGALRLRLPKSDWGFIALRTIAEIGAAYFFLTALFNMEIANVTAILQALPLTVTLAGAVFLGEAVGWRRLLAILVGFLGVMLIVRPGPDGFNSYAVYALIAVAFVTMRDLASRRLSKNVPSLVVALAAAAGVTLFAAIGTISEQWVPVSELAALQLMGASFFIIGGYLFSVMVMRVGDIGFVAPFRYTGLLWALIMGFFVFGDWPDPITLLGGAIVVATGIFTFYRERKLAKRERG